MKLDLRSFTIFAYFAIFIVAVITWIVSANDLLFRNIGIENAGLTFKSFGNWDYWIFFVSLVFMIVFAYYTYVWIRDDRKFYRLTSSESKQSFMKNLAVLEKIASKHGALHKKLLKQAKEKWKVR